MLNSSVSMSLEGLVQAVQVQLTCRNLQDTIDFLCGRLGFKVRMIMPSDAPSVAVLSAHGCTLRLVADATPGPFHLSLICDLRSLGNDPPRTLHGPDGLQVDVIDANAPLVVPDVTQEFVLTHMKGPEDWGVGRAGMLYRDLIPSRLGGRFVASHICIPRGGPVPDYVHYHKVRFQMIYCKAGWVRLVYEDQGDSFLLRAGDCVLQPPEIRHRVLESSDGLEVIEVACPAVHETYGDPELQLPSRAIMPDRQYQGQTYVRHQAQHAVWGPARLRNFEARDTGIAAATNGLADVKVLRAMDRARSSAESMLTARVDGDAELRMYFVLIGQARLSSGAVGEHLMHANDCCVLPSGCDYRFSCTGEVELLEVCLPA